METGVIYSKFRSIQSKVNDLIGIVRSRGVDGSDQLVIECMQAYFESRINLLRPLVQVCDDICVQMMINCVK